MESALSEFGTNHARRAAATPCLAHGATSMAECHARCKRFSSNQNFPMLTKE